MTENPLKAIQKKWIVQALAANEETSNSLAGNNIVTIVSRDKIGLKQTRKRDRSRVLDEVSHTKNDTIKGTEEQLDIQASKILLTEESKASMARNNPSKWW